MTLAIQFYFMSHMQRSGLYTWRIKYNSIACFMIGHENFGTIQFLVGKTQEPCIHSTYIPVEFVAPYLHKNFAYDNIIIIFEDCTKDYSYSVFESIHIPENTKHDNY